MKETESHKVITPQDEPFLKFFPALTCAVDKGEPVDVLDIDYTGATLMRLEGVEN